MSVRTDLLFKSLKLSYSTYNLMKCPIKYYVIKFLGLETSNKYSFLGVLVHKAYEIFVRILYKNRKEYLSSFSERKIKKLWDYSIRRAIEESLYSFFKVTSFEELKEKGCKIFRVEEVEQELETFKDFYPPLKFSRYLLEKIASDYTVEIESEYVVELEEPFFGISELYIRPDIVLLSKDRKEAEIIDIKTSQNIQSNFLEQLVFYAYSYSISNKKVEKVSGTVFYARYGSFKTTFKNLPEEKIREEFTRILKKLEKFYLKFQIRDRDSLRNFVEKISSLSKESFYQIKMELFKNYGNVCSFCPLSNLCPIKAQIINPSFSRILRGENLSDIVVVSSSYDRKVEEIVGYFLSCEG